VTQRLNDGSIAKSFVITPKVDERREFLEISRDFGNPLELVREAVSNSYDAGAEEIQILFDMVQSAGEDVLRICINDDGEGMDEGALQAFFDLGNSPRREQRLQDPTVILIGEKGHGTKVYFNSARIEVTTCRGADQDEYKAVFDKPFARLNDSESSLEVQVTSRQPPSWWHGTRIEILNYNKSRRGRFSHAQLRDYVLWFTRFGSVRDELTDERDPTVMRLKGLDREEPEKLVAGHVFPKESPPTSKLLDDYMVKAPDHYARRLRRRGHLPDSPDIAYDASFWVEGDGIKSEYNPMIRRQGKPRQEGSYQVQERYGLWLCKDFVPIEARNEWIITKGREFTKFHAFFNCQAFNLTANRGSVQNTPSEILAEAEKVCKGIYHEILGSTEWTDLEYLDEQAGAYTTLKNERRGLERRVKHIKNAPRCEYKGRTILAPKQEAGVYSVFLILSILEPDLFPFEVLDYDTHQGIDIVAQPRGDTPMTETKLRYVEFKYRLSAGFNHTFDNLHSIVCWELGRQVDEEVQDAAQNRRTLQKAPPGDGEPTKYFLDDPKSPRKIEVLLLPLFIDECCGIRFQ